MCVCVKFSHTVNTAVHSAGNPFATSHSPFSVSERAVPAPSPYSSAAAPCPDCETKNAHSPSVHGQKRGRHEDEHDKEEEDLWYSIAIKRKTCLTNGVLPAAQSCLFLFLFVAPFPHKDAGSHDCVMLLFCVERIQM